MAFVVDETVIAVNGLPNGSVFSWLVGKGGTKGDIIVVGNVDWRMVVREEIWSWCCYDV